MGFDDAVAICTTNAVARHRDERTSRRRAYSQRLGYHSSTHIELLPIDGRVRGGEIDGGKDDVVVDTVAYFAHREQKGSYLRVAFMCALVTLLMTCEYYTHPMFPFTLPISNSVSRLNAAPTQFASVGSPDAVPEWSNRCQSEHISNGSWRTCCVQLDVVDFLRQSLSLKKSAQHSIFL